VFVGVRGGEDRVDDCAGAHLDERHQLCVRARPRRKSPSAPEGTFVGRALAVSSERQPSTATSRHPREEAPFGPQSGDGSGDQVEQSLQHRLADSSPQLGECRLGHGGLPRVEAAHPADQVVPHVLVPLAGKELKCQDEVDADEQRQFAATLRHSGLAFLLQGALHESPWQLACEFAQVGRFQQRVPVMRCAASVS
jgi:hypothetical protein